MKPVAPNRVSDYLINMGKFLESTATKEEILTLLKFFAEEYKKLQEKLEKSVSDSTAENKAVLASEVKKLGTEVAALEKRLRELVAGEKKDVSTTLSNEFDKQLSVFASSIGFLEDFVEKHEDYDDAEVRKMCADMMEHMTTMEKKIPVAFDATEIMEDIEELEKKVEELEKRPAGRGGGMTDRGLQYAMSRIVKQETPAGTINGSNATFTVTGTIHAILSFELNSRVVSLGEYTITGGKRMTIVFDTAIPASYSGKSFVITYV